ncbi:MAG: efflux RND transporter periplasmic adaptor subunit [Saprospiraceae bacterium]|nr:efflux RND transporter periplasmic adaptor subunit [Saprospiraceae bacterium]
MKIKSILGLSSISIVMLTSCGKKTDEKEMLPHAEAIEVQLSKPMTDSINQTGDLLVNGRMESYKSSNISSRVMGNVSRVLVREGQTVKQGQLLIQIQAADLMSQKSRLEESLTQAKSGYAHAEKNYNRFKALHEQMSATDFELDQAQLQLDAAISSVGQIKQSIVQIQILIGESNVKSPFDGTITAIYTETGSMANPGMPLLMIETSNTLILKVLIPESEIQNINKNQDVSIQLQQNGEMCTGKILHINPSANLSGSQYEMEIKPDAQKVNSFGWKAGMYASAIIKRQTKSLKKQMADHEIIIPKKALIEKGQLYGIYTISDDQKAILRWVRLGKDYGDQIEILSGLKKEESFITEADNRLYNGAPIQVK